jgi:uncharacterized protein DUF4180
MSLRVLEHAGEPLVEGAPGTPFMTKASDVDTLLEECFAARAGAALLYAANLPPRFFDLSSGDLGVVLQKLRQYQVRLAVVLEPASALSQRFPETLREASHGGSFALFDTREAALAWLAAGG